jgi:CopG family transcriptional regulator/antitoxin EndoAI
VFTQKEIFTGGLVALSHFKKVLITMPDSLLEEIDALAKKEKKNRSEMVREVMKIYIKEKQHDYIVESLSQGYREMAEINLEIAQKCFDADDEVSRYYEEKLTECE